MPVQGLSFSVLLLGISVVLVAWICKFQWRSNTDTPLTCSHGSFLLAGMKECVQWLTCKETQTTDFSVAELIGGGAVKMVYRAKWRGMDVALNTLRNSEYRDDYHHGLQLIRSLQDNKHIVKLIGVCGDTYVTEYHGLGLTTDLVNQLTSLQRFNLCIDYVRILLFLHTNPMGPLVMCDSNDLHKTLSQYLINDDHSLVLNDVDSVAVVQNGVPVKCGHRELHGDFIAPEQKWPYPEAEFNDSLMPAYDEKTDIWKIPKVCVFFLGKEVARQPWLFHVFKIHKQCVHVSPTERPSASEVLEEYLNVKKKLI